MSAVVETPTQTSGDARLEADAFDEAYEGGAPRRLYADLLSHLSGARLQEAGTKVRRELERREVRFGLGPAGRAFLVDPVPRLLSAAEWEQITRAVEQRHKALNAFLADAYSERRIVSEGIVPERLITSADHWEPALEGLEPGSPAAVGAAVLGLDLLRGPDGGFQVLEDNSRTPSGLAYAAAARRAVTAALGEAWPEAPLPDPGEPDAAFELLARAIRAAAPDGIDDPQVVVLSDGPEAGARYEHEALAAGLGAPTAAPADLETSGERLFLRSGDHRLPVDVIYRRTDGERLSGPGGEGLTALGELLMPALRAGNLGCVNSFGAGVADDKLTHAYVEKLIAFYLGEEPVLRSVPTYDLGDPSQRIFALERIETLVLKPRSGLGGGGVVLMASATAKQRMEAIEAVHRRPGEFIAQPLVNLSVHPTSEPDGALAPRHVDLRPYAFATGEGVRVAPLAMTRFALEAGEMVVNSSRNGGAKDTWVIP